MMRSLLVLALTSSTAWAQSVASLPTTWQRPPAEVQRVLDAPDLPGVSLSPTRDNLLLFTSDAYPPLADMSRPSLRLAGLRFYPSSRAKVGEACTRALTVKRVDDGVERPVPLPAGACVIEARWSADGARVAIENRSAQAVDLWILDIKTLKIKQIKKLALNPAMDSELQWMPDQRSVLVKAVPAELGPAPTPPITPLGPIVAETRGSAVSSTYEARDLLTTPFDDVLFGYYASSQLALVNAESGALTPIGAPGLYGDVSVSPDGSTALVQRLEAPFSHRVGWYRFARTLELWDVPRGTSKTFVKLPAAETVPLDGVPTGPRYVDWQPTAPRTLVWLEALDGGDPSRPADHRDRLVSLALDKLPLDSPATELHLASQRISSFWFGAEGQLLVEEWDRDRRWLTTSVRWGELRRVIFDRSENERYGDPGWPMMKVLPTGRWALATEGDAIFLSGAGSSPTGDRPFVDRYDLRTGNSQRLFRCGNDVYETVVDWLDLPGRVLLTRLESPTLVPNYQRRALFQSAGAASPGESAWQSEPKAVTVFTDPAPALRQIQKRLVCYTRADGVPLSFTLYLPPGYKEGTALPTVLTAYPLEYSDAATAGQVTGSDRTFLRLKGSSPLFLLLSGYAVLNNTSMPVIGPPDTAYDTFIEQIVSSASAAIDAAVALGVTDRSRVGVWGHSHGALMVANLLAHSDLFKAGIARSGAYNHTIRPFGFQSEHRTLWEATDTYLKLSPVMVAPRINEPLLLVHGAADQNPGTLPFQSQRLYEAIRGVGGTARLVLLPDETHGYVARESVEQVLWEQVSWFDRWLKGP